MNRVARTALIENLALKSPLTFDEFSNRFCKILDLSGLHFDCENETEWGLIEVDNIEFNISKPYEEGTLQNWDKTVPIGCNFGISLILYREHPKANDHGWAVEHLVLPVAQKLADGFNVPVYFHRTWSGPGKSVLRVQTFYPYSSP